MKKLGKWELIKKLGSGAFAEVWLATGPNRKNAPLVALKLVHTHLASDAQFKVLLQEEAWAASLLSHPNVVEIYEVSAAEGRPYLAMEFIPGQSLYAVLRKLSDKGERFSVEESAYAINQAALGLHYAHDVTSPEGKPLGLVHRDISPHNLIAADDGRVKVVDFGLARVASAQSAQNEQMEGKIAYMPPEQIRGERVDRRVDTFALGACLWELLAGQKMYRGVGTPQLLQQAMIEPPPDPHLVFSRLPPALASVIAKAITRAPEDRYQTALELAEALEPFITDHAAEKLARRVQSHFDFGPRTKEEAFGIDKPKGPARRSTVSSPKNPLHPGATGPSKRGSSVKRRGAGVKQRISEPEREGSAGRKAALMAVIILPLIAVGVIFGSGLAGKYLPVSLPAELETPEEVPGTVEDAGVVGLPLEQKPVAVDPPKKKAPKQKSRDAGS